MNMSKKGVTPVIATIILIAGTLVLSLVVGAYTFGLFGSNVKTTELTYGLLNSGVATLASANSSCGGAEFQMTFNNPGLPTYVQSIGLRIASSSLNATYYLSTKSSCTLATFTPGGSSDFNLSSGAGQIATAYIGLPVLLGNTYDYVISLGNGQSISGSLIAQ